MTSFDIEKFVQCNNTGRHWTHNFLACDRHSQCYSSGLSCDYTPNPLVPMMMCSNGEQRVPYTLVCDHVTHCDDGSDEDCVYRICTTQEFQCDNKQVSVFKPTSGPIVLMIKVKSRTPETNDVCDLNLSLYSLDIFYVYVSVCC